MTLKHICTNIYKTKYILLLSAFDPLPWFALYTELRIVSQYIYRPYVIFKLIMCHSV